MTRSEAIIISAAVALAMVPRFESSVQVYVKTHRTEIQMAMNQLQGKPPIPFAAPESVPAAAPGIAPSFELASAEPHAIPSVAEIQSQVRAQVAAERAASRVATHIQLARLQPELFHLRILGPRNSDAFQVYRLKTKKCPLPPAAPAVPSPESFSIETGS